MGKVGAAFVFHLGAEQAYVRYRTGYAAVNSWAPRGQAGVRGYGSGGTAAFMDQSDELDRQRPGRPSGAVAAVTHGRLVTIAREVFSQCGYDGTTFAEVARRAGLTRPALFYPGRRHLDELPGCSKRRPIK